MEGLAVLLLTAKGRSWQRSNSSTSKVGRGGHRMPPCSQGSALLHRLTPSQLDASSSGESA